MVDPVQDLMGFIDASPTQFHAVHNAAARLADAGFEEFTPGTDREPGARFVVRDGALVAWIDGSSPTSPLRLIGAHTDSPNLRLRPRPDLSSAGVRQLRIEVYGGALLNSWLDRDLGLAGRIALRDGDSVAEELYRSPGPLLRVPQLAIHLDREIGERGLQLDRQTHLTPMWGLGDAAEGDFRDWLAGEVGARPDEVLGWDLACFDHQPSAVLGRDDELLAAPRSWTTSAPASELSRRCSPCAGPRTPRGPARSCCSTTKRSAPRARRGADSTWLASVLEQRSLGLGIDRSDHLAALGASTLLSADMAHATHPNHPGRHEPGHWVQLGGGPVIKHNVNQRYATDAMGAAEFRRCCDAVGVEVQEYSHRGDLPCGSTIGPLSAAQLAVRTVDVGMPQLSMHSARELMAVDDVASMVRSFGSWLRGGAS